MEHLLNTQKIQFVCHHLHIDKSNTVTSELLNDSQVHMKEKMDFDERYKNKLY